MAAILTLHAALWEHRATPGSGEHFLGLMNQMIVQYDSALKMNEASYPIHPNISIGLFVWLLLKMDMDGISQNRTVSLSRLGGERRSWFVGRILRVAKLLSFHSWLNMGQVLLSFLEMSDHTPAGLESAEERLSWREDIRAEILSTATNVHY